MVKFLAALASTLIPAILVWYFSKKKNDVVKKSLNGVISYKMNRAPLYFLIGFGVVGMLFCMLAFVKIIDKGKMTDLIIGLVFTIFLTFIIFCIYSFDKHKTILKENTIEVISYFGKSRVMKWDEIKQIKFNASTGELVICGKGKLKARVNYFSVGFNYILHTVQEKTGLSV